MKKLTLLLIPTLLSANAFAGFTGASAQDNHTSVPHTSIAEFRAQTDISQSDGLFDMLVTGAKADEMEFVFQGKIINQIDNDTYTFSDGVDSIMIDLDESLFNGRDVSPQDTVVLYGEADYEEVGLYFDVDQLELAGTQRATQVSHHNDNDFEIEFD